MEQNSTVTVGEFRRLLESFPDEWEITFSGGLEFNRLKQRDEKMVNVEFIQFVSKDQKGHWHVTG